MSRVTFSDLPPKRATIRRRIFSGGGRSKHFKFHPNYFKFHVKFHGGGGDTTTNCARHSDDDDNGT